VEQPRGALGGTIRPATVKPAPEVADAYDVTVDPLTGAAPERCPRCAALVRSGAQWCTLCYADLRPPPPAPPPPAAVAPVAAAASSDTLDPLTAPLALLERGADEPASPDSPAADRKEAGWPCASCGTTVPLAEPNCTSCGAGFLAGTLPTDAVLDRLSRGAASSQTKALIMVGGSLGLLALLLAAMYLLGAIF